MIKSCRHLCRYCSTMAASVSASPCRLMQIHFCVKKDDPAQKKKHQVSSKIMQEELEWVWKGPGSVYLV